MYCETFSKGVGMARFLTTLKSPFND
jgi:hypothetical protein